MTEKRFVFVIDNGEYTFYNLSKKGEIMDMNETEDMLNELNNENNELKQFSEQVAKVIEGKMEDNICNDYKMEVLKEIWDELELDDVWFK